MEVNKKDYLLHVIDQICKINSKGCVLGRKQLMKVMFFLEHYDISKRKLIPEKSIGNNFIIYHYGPFSFEIMDEVIELRKEGFVEESGYSITITKEGREHLSKIRKKIPLDKQKKIESIVKIFGTKDGNYLEGLSLEMLKIRPEKKPSFMGMSVSAIIAEQN